MGSLPWFPLCTRDAAAHMASRAQVFFLPVGTKHHFSELAQILSLLQKDLRGPAVRGTGARAARLSLLLALAPPQAPPAFAHPPGLLAGTPVSVSVRAPGHAGTRTASSLCLLCSLEIPTDCQYQQGPGDHLVQLPQGPEDKWEWAVPKIIQSLVVKSALSCALLHLALFLALSITLSFALYFSLSRISRAFGPLKIPGPRPSGLFPQIGT